MQFDDQMFYSIWSLIEATYLANTTKENTEVISKEDVHIFEHWTDRS